MPYSEPLAQEFEAEYNAGFASGSWSRKLELEEPGEYTIMHSSTVMLHFPKTSHSKLDDWGQVQPPADPMMKPRVMHRGLEGLPGKLTNTFLLCAFVDPDSRDTITCEPLEGTEENSALHPGWAQAMICIKGAASRKVKNLYLSGGQSHDPSSGQHYSLLFLQATQFGSCSEMLFIRNSRTQGANRTQSCS